MAYAGWKTGIITCPSFWGVMAGQQNPGKEMKAYFISGIAGDHRVFRHIRLPRGVDLVLLDQPPHLKKESLSRYASRIATQINRGEGFVLAGLSFGGILAAEIAKEVHPLATILIASVPVDAHLPPRYRSVMARKLYDKIPVQGYQLVSLIHGLIHLDRPEDKKIFRQMVRECDTGHIRWAMGAVLQWKNQELPDPLFQIHGALDEVFPVGYTRPTHILPGAGHMLLFTHFREINRILAEILQGLEE